MIMIIAVMMRATMIIYIITMPKTMIMMIITSNNGVNMITMGMTTVMITAVL